MFSSSEISEYSMDFSEDYEHHYIMNITYSTSYFHEVALTSSHYFNSCWTTIDFLNVSGSKRVPTPDTGFHYSTEEKVIWGSLNVIESFVGIVLNFMIIFAVLGCSKLRKEYMTPSILSITASDFLFSLITIPQMSITLFTADVPYLTGCQLPGFIGYWLWLSTGLNLLGIAILRFIAVYFPKIMKMKRFKYACVFTPILGWIISTIILLPTLAGTFGQFGLECRSFRCQFINIDQTGAPLEFGPEKLFFALIVFPGCLMVLFNCATFGRVKNQSNKVFNQTKNFDVDASRKRSSKDKAIKRIIAIVTASYVLVYLPVMIISSLVPNAMVTHSWLAMTIQALVCSLVIVDPLTFIICHKKIRSQVKRRLYCISGKMGDIDGNTSQSAITTNRLAVTSQPMSND